RGALTRDGRQLGGIHVTRHGGALLPDRPAVVDTEVAADAAEPGLKVGAPVEGVQRLEDLDEDVLGQILGFVVTADELVRDVEHLAAVRTHDLFPRGLVTGQTPRDQGISGLSRRGRGINGHATDGQNRVRNHTKMPGPVPGFIRVHGEFWCDEVALSAVADALGTPTHVYSRHILRERYAALDGAFASYPHDLHYAIKANATLAI